MKKSHKIEAMLKEWDQGLLDPHYAGYFHLFNQQRFYQAHDVLEHLWLQDRRGEDGDFFKGLIQLAGAFVHIQKSRPRPARALLNLAWSNISKYPDGYWNLAQKDVADLLEVWSEHLAHQGAMALLQLQETPPVLRPTG